MKSTPSPNSGLVNTRLLPAKANPFNREYVSNEQEVKLPLHQEDSQLNLKTFRRLQCAIILAFSDA